MIHSSGHLGCSHVLNRKEIQKKKKRGYLYKEERRFLALPSTLHTSYLHENSCIQSWWPRKLVHAQSLNDTNQGEGKQIRNKRKSYFTEASRNQHTNLHTAQCPKKELLSLETCTGWVPSGHEYESDSKNKDLKKSVLSVSLNWHSLLSWPSVWYHLNSEHHQNIFFI